MSPATKCAVILEEPDGTRTIMVLRPETVTWEPQYDMHYWGHRADPYMTRVKLEGIVIDPSEWGKTS
jgi:hypothetical protein